MSFFRDLWNHKHWSSPNHWAHHAAIINKSRGGVDEGPECILSRYDKEDWDQYREDWGLYVDCDDDE